jgi:hypothetical protein
MRRLSRLLVLFVIIVVVVGGAYYLMKRESQSGGLLPKSDDAAAKGYAAVFLANDQVYFGKLETSGDVLVLQDVYYIRLNQTTDTAKTSTEQPQLALVKLGDQIHGPADEMRINQDQVLFVERIKDESTVVRAIMQEKENRDKPAADTSANAANTAANSQ